MKNKQLNLIKQPKTKQMEENLYIYNNRQNNKEI